MNIFLKLTAAAAAIFGLTACDALGLGGEKNEGGNAANTAATNTATTDANAAAPAGGKDPAAAGGGEAGAAFTGEVNRQFLIGRWTDTNDCNSTVEFLADSTFTVPGGGGGIWALDGDRLTFQGENGSRSARVQAIDANTITLLQDDGSLGRSTRCTN